MAKILGWRYRNILVAPAGIKKRRGLAAIQETCAHAWQWLRSYEKAVEVRSIKWFEACSKCSILKSETTAEGDSKDGR